ncbi:MAG: RluA family pseudouridine synthase [Bacteroidota bacterium]|jgi:23S rRNA pseudouridine1911/1915/1917 synthase
MSKKNGPSIKGAKAPERRLKYTVKEPMELLQFLQQLYPEKSRTAVKSFLIHKQVYINFQIVTQFNYPLIAGQEVVISTSKIPVSINFEGLSILYEDESIIVIDKSAGLLSIASTTEKEKTAYSQLRAHVKQLNPQNKLFVLHRLDKDTSGVMMFAKSADVQERMQRNWHNFVTLRTYVAVLEGCVSDDAGTISSWLTEDKAHNVISHEEQHGRQAVTHFKVIKKNLNYSMVEFRLETGRKNQIRVHSQEIGHSIVGDRKYGGKASPIGRVGLHANILEFIHPVLKSKLSYISPVPKTFLRLVSQK